MKKHISENFAIDHSESLIMPNWAEKLKEYPVDLIEEKKENTIEEIMERYAGKVVVLDLYIKDIEKRGQWDDKKNNFLRIGNMFSVDHHAPVKEFSRNISSTNLAIDWVKNNGVLDKNYSVVINHTDCDSVLSSLIIRGVLPPNERFAEAAIAADHTGEENEIADLLQALEDRRDLEFSVRNLKLLLDKKDLEPEAQRLLKKIRTDRKIAGEVAEKGNIINLGGVSYVQLDKKVESSYFPALIPDAQVILVFSPLEKKLDHWEVKIRLGMAAPVGLTLEKLEVTDFDKNFGCRWNAGSNRRAGGTCLGIEEYARRLNDKLQQYLSDKKR